MDKDTLFYSYSQYLKNIYGKKAYRVSVDAGFSCPNRGRDRNNPGCIYCDERGGRAVYLETEEEKSLENQVSMGIAFLKKRYNAEIFLLYFQAFSNTNAPVETLKNIYDRCLAAGDFKELIVSTRPDCIDRDKVSLLKDYKNSGIDVWVELGLQSARDSSLLRIQRGHTLEQFREAFNLCREQDLKTAVHVIFGLPGETKEDILFTVNYLSQIHPQGIKIHNLHIPRGTRLYQEYLQGEVTAPGDRRHLEYVISALEILPEDIIVMRLTCDTPKSRRAAPKNFWKKPQFYEKIRREMKNRATWQGRLYKPGGIISHDR